MKYLKSGLCLMIILGLLLANTTAAQTTTKNMTKVVSYSQTLGTLVLINPSIASITVNTYLSASQINALPSSWLTEIIIAEIFGGRVRMGVGNISYYPGSSTKSFDNGTYPQVTAFAWSAASTSNVAMTTAQIALLPSDWNMQELIENWIDSYSSDSHFTYSLVYSYDASTGICTFSIKGTYSVGENDFDQTDTTPGGSEIENITGGPPPTVYYGQTFPVNVTLQVWSCSNAAEFVSVATASVPSSVNRTLSSAHRNRTLSSAQVSAVEGIEMSKIMGGHSGYLTDYQDIYLGTFVAPQKTDIKSTVTVGFSSVSSTENGRTTTSTGVDSVPTSTVVADTPATTYQQMQIPSFQVKSCFMLTFNHTTDDYGSSWDAWSGGNTMDGYWTVKLVDAPANTATISATVTPIGNYNYWIKGASKQIDVKVP